MRQCDILQCDQTRTKSPPPHPPFNVVGRGETSVEDGIYLVIGLFRKGERKKVRIFQSWLTEFVVRNIIIAFKKVLPHQKCGMIRGTYVTNS